MAGRVSAYYGGLAGMAAKPPPLPHGIYHIGFDVEVVRSIRYFFRNIASTLA
jgi:hypothetical protein